MVGGDKKCPSESLIRRHNVFFFSFINQLVELMKLTQDGREEIQCFVIHSVASVAGKWIHGWKYGWIDGWIRGWNDGWIDG